MRISGIILAGGKSSRMGQAKPFVTMNGKRMINVAAEKLKELFGEVVIVTDRKGKFAGLGCKVVEDIVKGCGPLGGIYTGLREVSGDGAFFVACDMPFLHKGLISRLIDLTDFENYECVVPVHSKGLPQKRIEPLHAIYSKQIIPAIEKFLDAGRLSLMELLADCRCKYVDVGEDEVGSFTNVNTPEDLARCQPYPSASPSILSIVGKSDSGKTTLILKLLPELKRRGYRVAVAKHCPCGFDLDIEGKDSWKFTQAGGEGVFLTSQGSVALLRTEQSPPDIKERLQNYFSDFDIVLTEGYNNVSGIRRIEIVRKGIGRMDSSPDDVVAYVSDVDIDMEKRVFSPDDVPAIADFIVALCNH